MHLDFLGRIAIHVGGMWELAFPSHITRRLRRQTGRAPRHWRSAPRPRARPVSSCSAPKVLLDLGQRLDTVKFRTVVGGESDESTQLGQAVREVVGMRIGQGQSEPATAESFVEEGEVGCSVRHTPAPIA